MKEDKLLGNPKEIPKKAPPLPVFLTDEEEAAPVRNSSKLYQNRKRTNTLSDSRKPKVAVSVMKGDKKTEPVKVKKQKNVKSRIAKHVPEKEREKVAAEAVMVEEQVGGGHTISVPVVVQKDSKGVVRIINAWRSIEQVTVEDVVESVIKNRGFITYVARELNVKLDELKEHFINKYKEIGDLIEYERSHDIDIAERRLVELADSSGNHQLGAINMILKSRARDRGYAEKDEDRGKRGAIQINLVTFDKKDIMMNEGVKTIEVRSNG